MSKIDSNAKPIVFKLLEKYTAQQISVDEQITLSAWLAKMAIIADAFNAPMADVTQSQRTDFMGKSIPPAGCQVWIASYGGKDWRQLALYCSGRNLQIAAVADPSIAIQSGYAKTFAFGIGDLFAVVFLTDMSRLEFQLNLDTSMRRIWPTAGALGWPTWPCMSDQDADAAARVVERLPYSSDGPP